MYSPKKIKILRASYVLWLNLNVTSAPQTSSCHWQWGLFKPVSILWNFSRGPEVSQLQFAGAGTSLSTGSESATTGIHFKFAIQVEYMRIKYSEYEASHSRIDRSCEFVIMNFLACNTKNVMRSRRILLVDSRPEIIIDSSPTGLIFFPEILHVRTVVVSLNPSWFCPELSWPSGASGLKTNFLSRTGSGVYRKKVIPLASTPWLSK